MPPTPVFNPKSELPLPRTPLAHKKWTSEGIKFGGRWNHDAHRPNQNQNQRKQSAELTRIGTWKLGALRRIKVMVLALSAL
eukprot:10225434-Alexandrium_andersonii.AAC.1